LIQIDRHFNRRPQPALIIGNNPKRATAKSDPEAAANEAAIPATIDNLRSMLFSPNR